MLLKSPAVLQADAIESLVDVGMWVMESTLVKDPVVRDAVYGVLRHTFYEQFSAGVNHVEVGDTVHRMWRDFDIRTILVFSVEDVDNDDSCDKKHSGLVIF